MTAALLALAGNALGDDFTVADFTINPGETKTISIELNSAENSYIAFEFYMTLPKGITIPEDEDGYLMAELNSTRINRHVLEVSQMDDGSYHFLCYSNRNTSLKGISGEMISLSVVAAEDAISGTQDGKLLNQKLQDMDLSVRALNCLKAAEVETLGELVKYHRADLLKFRNFGKKSLTELDELLERNGLAFGMDISRYRALD